MNKLADLELNNEYIVTFDKYSSYQTLYHIKIIRKLENSVLVGYFLENEEKWNKVWEKSDKELKVIDKIPLVDIRKEKLKILDELNDKS